MSERVHLLKHPRGSWDLACGVPRGRDTICSRHRPEVTCPYCLLADLETGGSPGRGQGVEHPRGAVSSANTCEPLPIGADWRHEMRSPTDGGLVSLTRRYVAHDHKRECLLTFPDGLVPPLSITLDDSPPGTVVFWYDPGTVESTGRTTSPSDGAGDPVQ